MVKPNWQNKLIAWADDIKGSDFEWGETDCASLVVNLFTIAHGNNPFDSKTPESLSEAKKMKDRGTTVTSEIKRLGAVSRPSVSFSKRGDVLITSEDEYEFMAAGIYLGKRTVLVSSVDHGVQEIPVEAMPDDTVAYKIPVDIE